MGNEQRPTVKHRELCSMFCDSLDGRAVWGRMGMCICNAESLLCPCEIIIALLNGYTPIEKVNERDGGTRCYSQDC